MEETFVTAVKMLAAKGYIKLENYVSVKTTPIYFPSPTNSRIRHSHQLKW
ncbi:MAG: hypothetical protein LBI14_00280 [Treponema sp.]|jgi:hypothetical protein|nr:hypothetical protein [Treponema sp.]